MGGDGIVENPEIDELQMSAVCEAMNQMVGTASTSMSSMFNYKIDISAPTVKIQLKDKKLELTKNILSVPIIAVKFRLIIGNLIDSEIIQIMQVSSAKKQVASLMKMMSDMTETAVAAVTPPPTATVVQPQQIPQSTPQYQTPPIHHQARPCTLLA